MAYSNVMRYTGLSGVDTGSMVEAMMKVEGLKYDTLFKKSTKYTYQQEAYRKVGNGLLDIQKSKLDLLATGSFRKTSTFKSSTVSIKDGSGADSTAVSVKLGAGVTSFDETVKVTQLATADSSTLKGKGANNITAKGVADVDTLNVDENGDASINVSLNGTTKAVKLTSTQLQDIKDGKTKLADELNSSLATAFGSSVSTKGAFEEYSDDGGATTKLKLKAENGNIFKLSSDNGNVTDLGFASEEVSTAKSSSTTLGEMFGITGTQTMKINGNSFDMTETMTIEEFKTAFNNAAGSSAKMSYSSATGTFTINSTATGTSNALNFGDTDFSKLGDYNNKGAKDSIVEIGGEKFTSDSNKLTFDDGTSITYNATTSDTLTISSKQDADFTKNAVLSFVDMYNSLLSTIYDETKTTRPTTSNGSTYDPLTSDEQANLSETELTKWEENAKKGLLYKDKDLISIEKSLREVMSKGITLKDGSTVKLSDLGIKLDRDYSKGGKLSVDEDKLTEGIARIGVDNVAEAFGGASGYANNINKALNNAVGISGSLTKKVGLSSSPLYMAKNTMTDQIGKNQLKLADMLERLEKKENQYYKMFSYMEESITKSNNQLSSLGLGM